MKTLLIIGVLVVLGIGAFFMSQSTEPAAVTTEDPRDIVETNRVEDTHEDMDDMEPMDDSTVAEDPDTLSGTLQTDTNLAVDPNAQVFEVRGTNFAFDVKEIRVKEGDTVTINFASTEGFHDWVIDEFDAATAQVRPGTPTSVTFVADKAGTYEYYCSIGSHRAQGMVGKLIVE